MAAETKGYAGKAHVEPVISHATRADVSRSAFTTPAWEQIESPERIFPTAIGPRFHATSVRQSNTGRIFPSAIAPHAPPRTFRAPGASISTEAIGSMQVGQHISRQAIRPQVDAQDSPVLGSHARALVETLHLEAEMSDATAKRLTESVAILAEEIFLSQEESSDVIQVTIEQPEYTLYFEVQSDTSSGRSRVFFEFRDIDGTSLQSTMSKDPLLPSSRMQAHLDIEGIELPEHEPNTLALARSLFASSASLSRDETSADGVDPAQLEQQRLAIEEELKHAEEEMIRAFADAALDAAGIFDPTPISDGIALARDLMREDYTGAALSLVSLIPYIGDAAAKPFKAGRIAKKLARLRSTIARLEKQKERILSLMKRLDPRGAKKLETPPQRPDKSNTGDYQGTLRGEKVTLTGIQTRRISYTKRAPGERNALRSIFNSTARKRFLQDIGSDPARVAKLKSAGLTDFDIQKIKAGKAPDGYQVHHKLPLDDGGTNDLSNLVLIKIDPYHKTITNAQLSMSKGMHPGETRVLDFPVPDGYIYPP